MWLKWLHRPGSKGATDPPAYWWRQLEASPRLGLPFAHLFPRPPAHRRPLPTEAERLVRELVQVNPPEPMEEIVQAYRRGPPARRWAPVEPWQILSVASADEKSWADWGEDGDRVLAWFDQGDLMHAWPAAPAPSPRPASQRGLSGLVAWLKGLLCQPLPRSLELASAEP